MTKNEQLFKDLKTYEQWSIGVSMGRTNPLPLDYWSVFETKSAAENYLTNPSAYPGQIIAYAKDNGEMAVCVISQNPNNTNELKLKSINDDYSIAGVGQKTPEGGEIFSDYETNFAFAEKTIVSGVNSHAGAKGYYWHWYSDNTIQLCDQDGAQANPNGWNVGDFLYFIFDGKARGNGKLAISNITDNLITLKETSSLFTSEELAKTWNSGDSNYMVWNNNHPNKGDYMIVSAPNLIGAEAHGLDNTALGKYSSANGRRTIAQGNYSYTEGSYSKATGENAHAEGYGSLASGKNSHAEGQATKASNTYAHAEGLSSIASGTAAHAEGQSTTASGAYSHAEGTSSKAQGKDSHAEGNGTTASGQATHAEGKLTEAKSSYSHAEGYATKTPKLINEETLEEIITAAHAEGYETESGGQYGSHAEGFKTKAYGQSSHAEGDSTEASGQFAHAEGEKTSASRKGAHAEGILSRARGQATHAEGLGTLTANNATNKVYGEHVQGRFNIEDNSGKYAHTLGNGSGTYNEDTHEWENIRRSNAHTIDWSGNAWFAGDIKFGGTDYNDTNAISLQSLLSRLEALEAKSPQAYNGTVIVESNSNLISFTIEGIEYQAEDGMTWKEWCDSTYNTNDYRADSGGYVFTIDNFAITTIKNADRAGTVSTADTIVAGYIYYHTTLQLGGAD